MGLVAVLAIYIPKWYMNKKIDMSESFSMLAVIFYLFYSVNSLTYYSMQTTFTFLGVLTRLSKVFSLDEYKHVGERDENVGRDKVCVKLKDASYTWGFISGQPINPGSKDLVQFESQ